MSERGSVTVWLLGLCVCLLLLSGLSVDLWRVMNVRRELAGLADAAAIHGATALDEAAFRATGVVRLDPAAAQLRARQYLAARLEPGTGSRVSRLPDRVSVMLSRPVPLSLLGVLLPDGPLRVVVHAEVEPRRRE